MINLFKIFIPALLAAFIGWPVNVSAAPEHPVPMLHSPTQAIISPAQAHLTVTEKLRAAKEGHQSLVRIVVPQDAQNLAVAVPGHTILRWNSAPVILKDGSAHMTKRAELVSQRNRTAASLATVKARIDVWKAQTQAASSQELSNRQALMQEQMPKLLEEQSQLEETLDKILNELSDMPATSGLGQIIEIILAEEVGEKTVLDVTYNYDIHSCGWTPLYHFNAKMSSGKENLVDVNLLADVWQFSGIDWTGTEILLATRGDGPREPAPLREWHVNNDTETPVTHAPAPQPRVRGARAVTMAAKAEANHDVAPAAPVVADTETVYATWKLEAKGLPEGKSRMLISTDQWETPLQWLCRPGVHNSNVWIMADYKLPPDKAWPSGMAQYALENQNIGEGFFRPKGLKATLFFGSDPRMSVNTVVDSDKQGESGFINTSKTWTGAWTFTLNNAHDVPIKVRVERPAPILGNDNITVTYKDNPKAQINNKEHMLYWIVDVPAHGSTSIEQGITISSPVKLPLLPDVP